MLTGCNEHPRGRSLAIFNRLEVEFEGEEKTHCPLRTHVAKLLKTKKLKLAERVGFVHLHPCGATADLIASETPSFACLVEFARWLAIRSSLISGERRMAERVGFELDQPLWNL
jgi:hypothetical protein